MVYSIHEIRSVLKDSMSMKCDRFAIIEIIHDMNDNPISFVDFNCWGRKLSIYGQNRPLNSIWSRSDVRHFPFKRLCLSSDDRCNGREQPGKNGKPPHHYEILSKGEIR